MSDDRRPQPGRVRVAPAATTTSSAPRRAAPCASARRRSPSRPRSSRATPTSSRASSSTRCARPRTAAAGDERERLYRLRKTCEGGLVSAELAEREDELENAILAARVTFQGEEMPLRAAQARLAVLDAYADREELGELERDASRRASTPTGSRCSRPARSSRRELSGEPDPVERNEEEKAISLRELERALVAAADATTDAYGRLRDRWFERLLGPGARRDAVERATSPTCAGSRRSSRRTRRSAPSRSASRRRAALGFDLTAIPNIRLDLEDRPQKNPRACVIASDPPEVVHLITRAQGGLADYQAFLHEAGHALHYAGCDPRAAVHLPPHLARPRADRDLLVHRRGDHARARLARAPLRPLRRAGGGERARRRSSSRRCSTAATRRSSATSSASGRASPRRAARSPRDYAERSPRRPASATTPRNYLSDMDGGFYSADYLRAWIRSAQLRAYLAARDRRRLVAQPATRARSCAASSPRARGRRARRSPAGSASTRSTRARSSRICPRRSPDQAASRHAACTVPVPEPRTATTRSTASSNGPGMARARAPRRRAASGAGRRRGRGGGRRGATAQRWVWIPGA